MPWELCKAEVLINSVISLLNLCRWFANIKTVLKLEYPAWKLDKKINNIFCFFQQDYGVDRRIAWQVYKMLCYFFLSTTVTSSPNSIWVNSFFDCSSIMSFKSIFFPFSQRLLCLVYHCHLGLSYIWLINENVMIGKSYSDFYLMSQ